MNRNLQVNKSILQTALRQGKWIGIDKKLAIAALETVRMPAISKDYLLLPAIFFPLSSASKIGDSHYYVRPKISYAPENLTKSLENISPNEWDVLAPTDQELSILSAALRLIKEAALLPVLIIAQDHLAEASFHMDLEDLNKTWAIPVQWSIAARADIPLSEGRAELVAFRPDDGGQEQSALLFGPPKDVPAVRLHSQCLTGDVFGSQRCDCGEQLIGAMQKLAEIPQGGILLYLAQEGRGIGLVNKLRAYRLQDQGFDTFDANLRLGFAADERNYESAASMLKTLGFTTIDLMSNNPEKATALEKHGIKIRQMIRHAFPPNRHNESYLATKTRRFGHLF